MKNTSVLITGVGGQGTLFASKVFGQLALNMGFDVKLSEVHGMAQRGGSVVTHVRFGEKIASPIIDKGGADIILSFELMEAMRWLDYLKNGRIKDNTTTPGLAEAREKLLYMQMSRSDQIAYERHLDAMAVQSEAFLSARLEGFAEGRAEGKKKGRAEGRAEGIKETARNLKSMGVRSEDIAKATGLTIEEISGL